MKTTTIISTAAAVATSVAAASSSSSTTAATTSNAAPTLMPSVIIPVLAPAGTGPIIGVTTAEALQPMNLGLEQAEAEEEALAHALAAGAQPAEVSFRKKKVAVDPVSVFSSVYRTRSLVLPTLFVRSDEHEPEHEPEHLAAEAVPTPRINAHPYGLEEVPALTLALTTGQPAPSPAPSPISKRDSLGHDAKELDEEPPESEDEHTIPPKGNAQIFRSQYRQGNHLAHVPLREAERLPALTARSGDGSDACEHEGDTTKDENVEGDDDDDDKDKDKDKDTGTGTDSSDDDEDDGAGDAEDKDAENKDADDSDEGRGPGFNSDEENHDNNGEPSVDRHSEGYGDDTTGDENLYPKPPKGAPKPTTDAPPKPTTETPPAPTPVVKDDTITVIAGDDTVIIPLTGPVSVQHHNTGLWTDFVKPRPSNTATDATVIQNGLTVTVPMAALNSLLPIGKDNVPWKPEGGSNKEKRDQGDAPLVYEPVTATERVDWRYLHPSLRPHGRPASAPTTTLATSIRPTPHLQ